MSANALTGKWNQAIQITSNIAAVHYSVGAGPPPTEAN